MRFSAVLMGVLVFAAALFLTSCNKKGITEVKDSAGNVYRVVKLNDQFWMADNLKSAKGTVAGTATAWKNSAMNGSCCCWYSYNSSQELYQKTGMLYSKASMKSNPCPSGWHVPTLTEWNDMVSSLGGNKVAGKKLKSNDQTFWADVKTADNSASFNGVGSGCIDGNGNCGFFRTYAYFWTQEANKIILLEAGSGEVKTENAMPGFGYSIRCVKD